MNIDEKIAEYKVDIKKYECVYKASAIGSIREMAKEKAEDCRQMMEWLEELKQLREQASSSEEPNKWIPISKETPKENGYYLTTTMFNQVYCDYWNGVAFDRDETVIAWCKLPLPYKAERDDESCDEIWEKAYKEREAQPSEDWNAVLDELIRIGRNAFKDDTDYDNLFDFISNLPNVNPQPSERTKERTEMHACDCISRQAVLEITAETGALETQTRVKALPSVTPQSKEEPQQKTGHWVLSGGYWRCSECKEKALLKLDKATGGYREYEPVRSKYCPECGAKMQEVQE